MKRFFLFILLAGLACLYCSSFIACASAPTRSFVKDLDPDYSDPDNKRYSVVVNTVPEGADVYCSNQDGTLGSRVGTSPVTINVVIGTRYSLYSDGTKKYNGLAAWGNCGRWVEYTRYTDVAVVQSGCVIKRLHIKTDKSQTVTVPLGGDLEEESRRKREAQQAAAANQSGGSYADREARCRSAENDYRQAAAALELAKSGKSFSDYQSMQQRNQWNALAGLAAGNFTVGVLQNEVNIAYQRMIQTCSGLR